MVTESEGQRLKVADVPVPEPGNGQVRIRVSASAVCRTDLRIVDGELTETELPLIPGHQIVGRVDAAGPGSDCSFNLSSSCFSHCRGRDHEIA